jgi:hypothetical protein
MSNYMTHDDPHAHDGMEVKENPALRFSSKRGTDDYVLCPKCKGYGGHHLRLNAYGEGKHFNAFCRQCVGWGWVEKDSLDETCVHKMGNRKTIGNCLNEYTCEKCGKREVIDSSD